MIEALLVAGADIEAQDDNGNTPLSEAAWSNENVAVLEALPAAGANRADSAFTFSDMPWDSQFASGMEFVMHLLLLVPILALLACGENEVNPISPSSTAPPSPSPSATLGTQDSGLAPSQLDVQPSETWRGLTVAPEHRCSPYDADDYSYLQSVEDRIVIDLGGIYSPYTCELFDSTRETDIEHIVARSEAHDSGLCAASAATRRSFARDLRNLTLASPDLNRRYKGALDVAEWHPEQNRCWFAQTVIQIRQSYGLTIDRAEVNALNRLLAGCGGRSMLSCDIASRDPEPEPGDPPDEPDQPPGEPPPPPVETFRNCSLMRSAGWTRGVNQNGGTYRRSWDDAERRTYQLNTSRDRDKDGHACE